MSTTRSLRTIVTAGSIAATTVLGGTAAMARAATTAGPATAAPSISAAACSPAVSVRLNDVRSTYRHRPVESQGISLRSRCRGVKGVDGLVRQVRADAAARWRSWATTIEPGPTYEGHYFGGYWHSFAVPVNTDGLVVVEGRTYLDWGGAHGINVRDYSVLNTRTGRLVSKAAMLAELRRLAPAGVSVDARVKRALDKAAGGGYDGIAFSLKDSGVHVWPGRSGLHASVDHCAVYACASGVVEATIPWDRLVAKGRDVSFVPNRWGH